MSESISNLPEAIFFDLDGTLLDSLPGIEFSIEQAFLSCGLPKQPIDLRQTIGPPIGKILALASPHATESELVLLERAFRTSYDSDGWKKTLVFPGCSAMLREAHALAIRLFVVSNKPRHISANILEREGILPLFLAVVTRDSVEPPYPSKAHMIEHLLHTFQLQPARCIMVGDTTEDAHAAAAMQVSFAWVAHGYGELLPSQAIAYRIDSFPEFLPTLIKEFAQ